MTPRTARGEKGDRPLNALAVAMKTIPMGTAYAVWTGIGAIGGVVVGIIAFGESASVLRIASAALIVAGIVGLKLAAK